MPTIRSQIKPTPVCSYGFKAGLCCDNVTSILRPVLILAFRWGCKLLIGSLDVAIAFDSMDHELLVKGLLGRGLHPESVACLLRELSGMHADITIPGAGSTPRFPLERGGKQGGVETPDEFNLFIEHIIDPW